MTRTYSSPYRIHRLAFCLALCVAIIIVSAEPVIAGDGFELGTTGRFVPTVNLKDSHASLSTSQAGLEFSAGIFGIEYTLTSFAWDSVSALPFGDGRNTPWQDLHEVSADAQSQGKFNDTWGYLGGLSGGAAFENSIDDAFLEFQAIGGMRYTVWDDRFYVMAGGGVASDDFGAGVVPAGGFEWRIGHGFNLAFIYPVKAELSFTSRNDKLSAEVNVMNGHTDIAYTFTPELRVSFSYDDHDTFHRLTKNSVVEPLREQTYLETEDRFVSLEVRYAPLKQLTCNLGVEYNFSRKLALFDDEKEELQSYNIDPAVGGTFGIAYMF